jgi:hypothetical protein
MDASRFDSLTRSLHDVRSRRDALAALLGGTLAAVGAPALADAKSKAKYRCRQSGSICLRKPKKGGQEKKDCKFCCGGSFSQLSSAKGRCCNNTGVLCATSDQCCFGGCTNGTCQTDVSVLPPPPPPGEPAPPPPPPPPGTPACIPYAGACTQHTDCCSAIPCTGFTCRYP